MTHPVVPNTERVEWLAPFGRGDVTVLEARRCARDWRIYHDSYAFCAVHAIRGEGPKLKYRHWQLRGTAQQVQLYEPGEVHQCSAYGAGDFTVLMFAPRRFTDTVRSLRGRAGNVHFNVLESSATYAAFAALSRSLTANDHGLALDVRLAHCVSALVRYASIASDHAVRIDRRTVLLAKQYLDAAAESTDSARLRLADVVTASGAASDAVLCRDFKRQFNASPYQYFKLRRLEIGRRLLESSKPIRTVAWACGYDPAVFSREFHETYGVTASAYRSGFARTTMG